MSEFSAVGLIVVLCSGFFAYAGYCWGKMNTKLWTLGQQIDLERTKKILEYEQKKVEKLQQENTAYLKLVYVRKEENPQA